MGLKRRIRERGVSIGLMAFVSVFALACASLWGFRQLSDWVDHTQQSIFTINEIQMLIERREASARGFVLTRNPRIVEYGEHTCMTVARIYDELAASVSDNSSQRTRLLEARDTFERRAAEVEDAVAHPDDKDRLFNIATLKKLRQQNQEFEDVERRLLDRRATYADWLSIAAALFMTIGFSFAVLLTRTGQAYIRVKKAEWISTSEQATELARIKSDFLAMMSHEIRTPATGMIGMCNLLLAGKLDDEQAGRVRTIRSSVDSLLVLVNQVLDHGRIESGRIELAPTEFDPRAVFGSALDLFRAQAAQKNIDLRLAVGEGVPSTLKGDAIRLRQVLINLVSNALKFTESGRVLVVVEQYDNELHVEVEDTGRGIPPDARLFQKYAQVRPSGEGSGLGLLICKGLVEAMEGEIGYDSREGRGSRFWFSARIERVTPVEVRPMSGRVLIAEDHPINQAVIRKYVESFGLKATVVGDGKAAVDAVAASAFDLVLMDCQMPGMDGFAATWLIRRLPKTAGLPILALTATGTPGDRERCLSVGMNDYLIKPIDAERLRVAIARHLPASEEFEPETLARLRGFTSNDRPLIEVLRDALAEDGARSLMKMEAAAGEADLKRMSELAHALKSAGRSLGLAHFGRLCEELERAPTTEIARVQELREALGRAQNWLRAAEI